jgi:hypothetical protein
MDYRRGFFRLWIAFSALWGLFVWWLAQYTSGLSCMYGEHGPWCDYRMVPDFRTGMIYLLVGPGVMLAVGSLAGWIIAGFRRPPSP